MHIKHPEEIINSLFKKYSTQEENIIHLERLFMAASVIRWVFRVTNKPEEIVQYMGQIEKYLKGELELYWEAGVIKVKRVKRGKQ
jgi:hypothetical protein